MTNINLNLTVSRIATRSTAKVIYHSTPQITKIQSTANVSRKISKSHGMNLKWEAVGGPTEGGFATFFTRFIDIEFDFRRVGETRACQDSESCLEFE